jgi:hypothetical protein
MKKWRHRNKCFIYASFSQGINAIIFFFYYIYNLFLSSYSSSSYFESCYYTLSLSLLFGCCTLNHRHHHRSIGFNLKTKCVYNQLTWYHSLFYCYWRAFSYCCQAVVSIIDELWDDGDGVLHPSSPQLPAFISFLTQLI